MMLHPPSSYFFHLCLITSAEFISDGQQDTKTSEKENE